MDALKEEIAELKTELNKKFDQFTKLVAKTAENTELELTKTIIRAVTIAFDEEILSIKEEVAALKKRIETLEHARMPSPQQ